MSVFRNLLKNNSPSFIRLLPDSLDYTSEGGVKTLSIETNKEWFLSVNYKDNLDVYSTTNTRNS